MAAYKDLQHQSSDSSLECSIEPCGPGTTRQKQLQPGEKRSFMETAGCASVYLEGTEYGMPIMFLEAENAEVTHDALSKSLQGITAVLREKTDFALCLDLREMRRPAMSDSRTVINWMNEEENSTLLGNHAMITCVMVANSWAGMAISTGTKIIQSLCNPAKPAAVVYTEDARDAFLKESIVKHVASKCDSRSTADE
ncbi:unnamed protein product [Durusdinium trenchii]|uniref:Proteasome assembly chaperone 1 n=1 Tax=Durusdinium trenchii TaxID=1381693 RepID=A0ABP0MZ41_9DINO